MTTTTQRPDGMPDYIKKIHDYWVDFYGSLTEHNEQGE